MGAEKDFPLQFLIWHEGSISSSFSFFSVVQYKGSQLFPHCRPPADMLPWQPLMVQAASNSLSNLLCPSLGTTCLAPGYSVAPSLSLIQCTKLDRLGFLSRNQDLDFLPTQPKHTNVPSVSKRPFADLPTLTEVLCTDRLLKRQDNSGGNRQPFAPIP